MFDSWFTVDDPASDGPDPDLDGKAQAVLRLLNAKQIFIVAAAYERIHGYSLIVGGFDDAAVVEDLKKPLRRGAKLTHLQVYSKPQVFFVEKDMDPNSLRFGLPVLYRLNRGGGAFLEVHYTRVIRVATRHAASLYFTANNQSSTLYSDEFSALDVLWDDMTIFRNMRWGLGQTIFRYGSGFPVFKRHDNDNTKLAAMKAELENSWLAWTFLACNDTFDVDFKGAAGSALNPTPYYDVVKNALSMATAIPSAILEGTNAGALTGSETNITNYFKTISVQQSLVVYAVKELLDWLFQSGQIPYGHAQSAGDKLKRRLLRAFGRDEASFNYEINWTPCYEVTDKEQKTSDLLLEQAQQIKLQYMTIDEVRALAGLDPLPNDEGVGLKKTGPSGTGPQTAPPPTPGNSPSELMGNVHSPVDQQNQNPALENAHPSLPALLRDLVKRVIHGGLTQEEALKEGTAVIENYTRLEEQQALIFVRHRTGNTGAVDLSPEMQQDLADQKQRYLKSFAQMIGEAAKLAKKGQP